MPKCLNDSKKTYKGDEPSPKGLGYSATVEEVGKIMEGKDDNLWIVKLILNGQKRWVKNISRTTEELKSKNTKNKKLDETNNIIIDNKELAEVKENIIDDKIQPTIKNANYYHVACNIFPHYRKDDCVGYDKDDYYEEIRNYIKNNNEIQCGDILFAGVNSDSLPRQEDGFIIVLKDGKFETSVGVKGPFLALDNLEKLSNKISYKLMMEELKEDSFFNKYFFMDDEEFFNDIKEEYQKNNIW
jgi:hypothetical protein